MPGTYDSLACPGATARDHRRGGTAQKRIGRPTGTGSGSSSSAARCPVSWPQRPVLGQPPGRSCVHGRMCALRRISGRFRAQNGRICTAQPVIAEESPGVRIGRPVRFDSNPGSGTERGYLCAGAADRKASADCFPRSLPAAGLVGGAEGGAGSVEVGGDEVAVDLVGHLDALVAEPAGDVGDGDALGQGGGGVVVAQ